MDSKAPTPNPTTEETIDGPKVRPNADGPMQVEIVAVGRELLRGRLADGNARTIADVLGSHGAIVRRITIVDDDHAAVRDAVGEALGRHPHLVVTTGGLGPSPDDVTLVGVSKALERPLGLNQQARAMVEDAYRRLNRLRGAIPAGLNLSREKMCRIPLGSMPLENPRGLAPGVLYRLAGGAAVVCLPGHPKEMKPVLELALSELGDSPRRTEIAYREVESPTPDESSLKTMIESLAQEYRGVWIATRTVGPCGDGNRVVVTFESLAATREDAEARVAAAVRRLLALASGA